MYSSYLFFFNDTATTEIYTLSLHDALPISLAPQDGVGPLQVGRALGPHARQCPVGGAQGRVHGGLRGVDGGQHRAGPGDRKSTRLNSSHANISYAVFCLKKKKTHTLRPGQL